MQDNRPEGEKSAKIKEVCDSLTVPRQLCTLGGAHKVFPQFSSP